MSTTTTTEVNTLAIEHAPLGSGGGGGSSLAHGNWPNEEPEVIPPGNQLPRTPAPSDVIALRRRVQESASKKATSLAAASLAGLDILAASTGRSVELSATGGVQQQPPQVDTHGEGQGPLSPLQEPVGGAGSLYPKLPGVDEFGELGDQESLQTADPSEVPGGTDGGNTSQEFMMNNNNLHHFPDDEDEVGMDVDDESASSEEDDHNYYPVHGENHPHITERRSRRSMHFPNRDLGQVDVLTRQDQEGPEATANDQNVAVEAALMEAFQDVRSYVIPKGPNGTRRPVPPNVVTTAGRAMAANRGGRAGRGSTTKRAHSASGTPANKARRSGEPPAGPPAPPPPGGGGGGGNGGGNGGPPNPPPGPPQANGGAGGPGGGDPGNNPPGGGGRGPYPGPGGLADDLVRQYRKSIPSKLYEIPKLTDLSDTNFVSWLQKGNEN